jgi:hypothetical protein
VSRFEDAFAGDVPDSSTRGTQPSAPSNESAAKADSTVARSPADSTTPTKTSSKKDGERSTPAKPATLAGTLLKLGQNLEKSGKTTAALGYYRRVANDFPATEAAKTATARIKALDRP